MKTTRLTLLLIALSFVTLQAQVTYTSSRSNKSGRTVYSTSNGVSSFNVEVRGKIELTDDDKDIKTMSSDGYLEVSKTVFGSRRALIITPQGSSLKREYYEGRTATAFEPEGRKWMNEILPELVSTTTIGAESRVGRFYRLGGYSAVLTEIERIESDYVKSAYASLLMQQNVAAKDYPAIINRITNTVDSDHYRSEFLKGNLDKFLTSKEATDAVFAASSKMESDHYKTEVIKEALRSQSASPDAVKSILLATSKMESDHYKSEVLTTLLRQPGLTDATISEMINTTNSIGSDHYRTQVLNKALEKTGLSATSYQKALEAVRGINSDHYKTEVLKNLLRNKIATAQIQALVEISTSIESDHYITEVLKTVLDKQDLNEDNFRIISDRISHMGSDYYRSVVLQEALKVNNLTDEKLIRILQAATTIGSDHYITEVLTDAAPAVKSSSGPVKDAYRAAAKKIDSETYYGRAMKALD